MPYDGTLPLGQVAEDRMVYRLSRFQAGVGCCADELITDSVDDENVTGVMVVGPVDFDLSVLLDKYFVFAHCADHSGRSAFDQFAALASNGNHGIVPLGKRIGNTRHCGGCCLVLVRYDLAQGYRFFCCRLQCWQVASAALLVRGRCPLSKSSRAAPA